MKYRIFVVDDDKHYARMLSYRLEKHPDYDVRVFASGEEVLRAMEDTPDLLLLDIMMPGIDGLEVLRRVKARRPTLPVVMVSAQGVIETAVESMKLGAYDYITKGQDDLVKLDTLVRNVLEKVSMERELVTLRGEVSRAYSVDGMIGDSPAMKNVYRIIDKALRGDLTVAIIGESGTGKELVAKAIHFNSARKRGPFVVVNCAAIPRELMESEFFGHEKGSFTGAHARKIGKFEQADGGTIFLDEIGELNLDLQSKLLRALQEGELSRVGGNDTIRFDARVISATNRDIVAMIRAGKFREDLYYRLFQYPVPLPPLRERGQDILHLANHFLREYTGTHPDFRGRKLSVAAKQAIAGYAWPGNVRELKSAIERAVLLADGDEISSMDLMLGDQGRLVSWKDRMSLAAATAHAFDAEPQLPVNGNGTLHHDDQEPMDGAESGGGADNIVSLDELKRRAVERAYRLCEQNVDRAAVELGIGRATMYRLLKRYELMP
jgi:DNA-binding NtrC family response regulator